MGEEGGHASESRDVTRLRRSRTAPRLSTKSAWRWRACGLALGAPGEEGRHGSESRAVARLCRSRRFFVS
ncbi:MAG: hypothetical protein ABJB40_04745 [Acidobacteriota bacterium]